MTRPVGLGIATFTAHMFIFYFAVASAITPPVAFAAASITKADPMMTGLSAVRSGIVMFVIPFVFAFYPELLLIPAAQFAPGTSGTEFLAGYDGSIHWPSLGWLSLRLLVALYLLASVLSRFDQKRLLLPESILRLTVALVVMSADPVLHVTAMITACGVVIIHARSKDNETHRI